MNKHHLNLAACLLVLVIGLVSCRHNVDTPTTPPTTESYVKYKADGLQFKTTGTPADLTATGVGIYCVKNPRNGSVLPPIYIIEAWQLNIVLMITLVTDTLKVGTYTTPTDRIVGDTYMQGSDSTLFRNGYRSTDFLTVNLTRSSSGKIDGTFSGKLYQVYANGPVTTTKETIITEGEFKNVEVVR
jgi:hypothetical protein